MAETAAGWTLPAYGTGSLADLLPSLAAHLRVPGGEDVLGLPAADRYVVLLVDGLGWSLLRRALAEAPYLAWLLGDGRPLTAGVPSTTATSLASLGTGLPPGQHGLVGYTSRVPGTGVILNALQWDPSVSPQAYQPRPTWFERAAAAGVAVTTVSLARFAGSGLTGAALRGGEFVGLADEKDTATWVAQVVAAAGRGSRSLVYAYARRLDHLGHGEGCASAAWLAELARLDAACARLRDALPSDVRLVVTGDHGMVDVPRSHRLVVEDEPDLAAGLAALAGEGRFRHLYAAEREVDAVLRRWADRLGPYGLVLRREEAVEAGWFGPVAAEVRERYGAVLVAMLEDWAVMTRAYPRELDLVGMHGSLTAAEMTVPLLWD